MSFAYSVAIKLSVANLASQGIRLLATDLLGAHGAAAKLEDKLKALRMAAVGYGMSKVGSGIIGFLEKSVDASKEYTRQMSLMNAAGMTQKDIAEATAAAWKTSHEVITSSAAGNLTAIRELRSVFGKDNMHEAYSILPTVQRTKAILEALTGKEQHGVAFDMVKAIELRTTGTMSASAMQKNADLMARTLMQMGGTVDVHDYHLALKYAKSSALKMSDEFVYSYLPTLIQEFKVGKGGASSAGTALNAGYRMIVGQQIAKENLQNWIDAGLINQSKVARNPHNSVVTRLLPGAIAGASLYAENAEEWAMQYGLPAVQRLMQARHLTQDQAVAALTKDSTKALLLNTLISKAGQFKRDKELIETGANSYDTYQSLIKTNPQLAEQAMHAQWNNVQARIGYEILPRLIPYMIKFADTLDGISHWMQAHPIRTEWLVKGLAAAGIGFSLLGKVLMTAGVIKFLNLGPAISGVISKVGTKLFSFIRMAASGMGLLARGLFFLGRMLLLNPIGLTITAIAVAAFLLWKNWDYIGPKLSAAWDSIKAAVGALGDWIRAKWEWIKSFLPKGWFEGGSQESPHVATKAQQPIQVHTQVNMDGRNVARVVTEHQANEALKPLSGVSRFDGRMSLAPVGLSGGW